MNNQQGAQITKGLLVVLIGLILLAGQLDQGWAIGKLWPLIFVVLGASQFATIDKDGRRGNGWWFLLLAAMFLMHNYRVLRINDSWPLFVVAAGVSMIFGRKKSPPSATEKQVSS